MNEITHKSKTNNNGATTQWSPNTFNNHFLSLAESVSKSTHFQPDEMFTPSPQLHEFCQNRLDTSDSLTVPLLTVHEVGLLITNLKNKKAMGPDNLNASLIKLALPYIVETLTYIYNLCIEQNVFP